MLPEILIQVALLIFCHSVFWFFISVFAKRNDVADIAWGNGFVLLVLFLAYRHPTPFLAKVVFILVVVWGVRLTVHIALRTRGKKEDFRYANWRREWGHAIFWRSFLQVYLLQGFFMFLIASPLYILALAGYQPLERSGLYKLPFLAGVLIWVIGFGWQAIGDYQLMQFKKVKKPGAIITTGLWKYSRHPNYFGEIAMWWGIWLMVVSLPFGLWAIISPITITYLLAKVSGVPMLEEKYKGNPAFEEYKRRTPALFPWWPKKN